jgi:hypothetical protein
MITAIILIPGVTVADLNPDEGFSENLKRFDYFELI